MKKALRPAIVLLVVTGAAALLAWRYFSPDPTSSRITLYGNVDMRYVSLAFNTSERVSEMRVQEGEKVAKGQALAMLDTTMPALRVERAQAQAQALAQGLKRLETGTRPEEIAQARAELQAAQAQVRQATQFHRRLLAADGSTEGRGIAKQELDAAAATLAVAQARQASADQALRLAIAGPRIEDIDQARAQLKAAEADLALLRQQLTDATLRAPTDAVVRSRLMEPGDMASPQQPAYLLALTDRKWIRAYLSEPDLGRVKPGQAADVSTDDSPKQPLKGQVGFISSVAEFTPKNVQTEDLRTSLVYEIRINVQDPQDRLRLGMPATVYIEPASTGAGHP